MSQTVELGQLESLPPELVTSILINLPAREVVQVCRLSRYLSSFCQSSDFWADKATHDFYFPRNKFFAAADTNLINPFHRYLEIWRRQRDPDIGLRLASMNGDLTLAQYWLSRGAYQLKDSLYEAASHGHLDIVKLLIQVAPKYHKFIDINNALEGAAEKGHLNVVKYLVDHGATNLNSPLVSAASKGYTDIAQYLISKGATNLNDALVWAAYTGNLDLIKYAISQGATDLNDALEQAAAGGNLQVVDHLISHGANDLNGALAYAAQEGHLDVVHDLLNRGAIDLELALDRAIDNQHIDIVLDLINLMAQRSTKDRQTILNDALEMAAIFGSLRIVKELIKRGATDINRALVAARQSENENVVKYLDTLILH